MKTRFKKLMDYREKETKYPNPKTIEKFENDYGKIFYETLGIILKNEYVKIDEYGFKLRNGWRCIYEYRYGSLVIYVPFDMENDYYVLIEIPEPYKVSDILRLHLIHGKMGNILEYSVELGYLKVLEIYEKINDKLGRPKDGTSNST